MADERLDALAILPIQTDHEPSLPGTMALARTYGMSYYDALYLELALRTSSDLATLDLSLRRAAAQEGIPVLTA